MKNYKKILLLGGIGSLAFAMILATTPVLADTTTQISGTSTLKVGSRNANVTILQQFLAANNDIYPTGSVTGYFGTLTKAAVGQFQTAYDLTADGVAGPKTIAKVNSIISLGHGLDLTAPVISNSTVNVSGRNVTFSLNTSENVKATIFYDTNKLSIDESSQASGVPIISGTQSVDSTFSSSKQITINNLNANTVYYYTVMVTDVNGNISLIWPVSFTIGQ